MFRTEAKKVASGNYLLAATCTSGHTCFKDQMHPNDPYKCPYSECGHAKVL